MLYKTLSAAVYGIDANIIQVEVDCSGIKTEWPPNLGRPVFAAVESAECVGGTIVMKRTVLLLAVVMLIPPAASAKNKLTTVKVEVVEQTTNLQERYGNRGSIVGRRTGIEPASLKVIINGDHALLRCYENHQGCNTLGPGTYDGEVRVPKCTNCSGRDTSGKGSDPDVWIYYIQPLDHQKFREHWRVSGTW
jgi:hypothetical protein